MFLQHIYSALVGNVLIPEYRGVRNSGCKILHFQLKLFHLEPAWGPYFRESAWVALHFDLCVGHHKDQDKNSINLLY